MVTPPWMSPVKLMLPSPTVALLRPVAAALPRSAMARWL
jgi:hypothetical protein